MREKIQVCTHIQRFYAHYNSFLWNQGIVTTAKITDATPSASYAHIYDRYWECDSKYETNDGPMPAGKHDIAWQLVNSSPGNQAKVVLGGGAAAFYPEFRKEELRAKVYL